MIHKIFIFKAVSHLPGNTDDPIRPEQSCQTVQVLSIDSPDKIQILPANKNLHRPALQGLEGVHYAKAVLPCVLADLLKVLGCKDRHINHQKPRKTISLLNAQ